MSAANLIKYLHLTYFSKTREERIVFRNIRKLGVGHIVEIGVGTGQLARQMIKLAVDGTSRSKVRYTGIDEFEMRDDPASGLDLRVAYQTLKPSDARIRLVPGDPFTALARHANTLLDTDLLVVRADQDPASMARAWFYVPRMLHDNSVVFV